MSSSIIYMFYHFIITIMCLEVFCLIQHYRIKLEINSNLEEYIQ